MKQIVLFFVFLFFCPVVFAIECPDDEKLIPIKDNQIGYSMYNEAVPADKIKDLNGAEWKQKNKTVAEQNVVGRALCLNSDVFRKDSNKIGNYCLCKIQEIDNYKVLSDWVNVERYQNHIFDENKNYSSETDKRKQMSITDNQNNQECMDNCAKACQSKLYKSIKSVRGFYMCSKALYKFSHANCVIDNKFVKAKEILVFDDVAEINTGDDSIIFTKSIENNQDLIYVGEIEYESAFLKVQNNTIYMGRKTYSMEECL